MCGQGPGEMKGDLPFPQIARLEGRGRWRQGGGLRAGGLGEWHTSLCLRAPVVKWSPLQRTPASRTLGTLLLRGPPAWKFPSSLRYSPKPICPKRKAFLSLFPGWGEDYTGLALGLCASGRHSANSAACVNVCVLPCATATWPSRSPWGPPDLSRGSYAWQQVSTH